MAGLRNLIAWWYSLPLPWRPWRIVGQVGEADEVPERLPRRGVVLVGQSETATWAVFDCPCRAGHRLMLNLDRTHYPSWRIESRTPLSIRPSVDDIAQERRCHFIIRDGKLNWANVGNRE